MKFRPLQDRILVKRVAAETKTASGIIIPDAAQEKPLEGEVVAVGDRVVFGKYAGSELKLDGEELLILTEADLLGVRL